jgi:hypothetical protein
MLALKESTVSDDRLCVIDTGVSVQGVMDSVVVLDCVRFVVADSHL